jgi:DNA adenine methylase
MTECAAPFLKWAGGKTRQTARILELLGHEGRYLEPFLGGGAVLFSLPLGTEAVLGDANVRLLRTYAGIRHVYALVHQRLQDLPWGEQARDDYTELRALFNRGIDDDADHAAVFIWLNKHGFNGLWRENSKGEYNVPRGSSKTPPKCPTEEQLQGISRALSSALIVTGGFEPVLFLAHTGDRVYCDPPYYGQFTTYTAGGFGPNEQVQLMKAATAASVRGARVVLSNSDTSFIRDLYRDWMFHTVQARRSISCTGDREPAAEVLITRKP